MDSINITVSGLDMVQSQLNDVISNLMTNLAPALANEADKILDKSLQEVPIDTGALQLSNYINLPAISGKSVSVEFGYGGPHVQENPKTRETTDEYAVIIHEDMTMNHPNGGKSKYLEDPVKESVDEITEVIQSTVNSLFGNRGL